MKRLKIFLCYWGKSTTGFAITPAGKIGIKEIFFYIYRKLEIVSNE
jgi:hypothetical protein